MNIEFFSSFILVFFEFFCECHRVLFEFFFESNRIHYYIEVSFFVVFFVKVTVFFKLVPEFV